MKALRSSLILLLCLSLSSSLDAQTLRADTMKVNIPFRRGVSSLDMDYNGTHATLDRFLRILDSLERDSSLVLRSLDIVTAASPEGTLKGNERLSRERGQSIREFLSQNTRLSPSQIVVDSRGENWEGLLESLTDCCEPWSEQARRIVSGFLATGNRLQSDSCKLELMALQDGEAWQWMDRNIFPSLRSAGGSIRMVTIPKRDTIVIYHEDVVIHKDTVFIEKESEPVYEEPVTVSPPQQKVPVLASRSNLLLPAMNIGIEVPVSNRLSIGADWYYPWAFREWMNGWFPSQQNCLQALAGSLEVRWWMGEEHRPEGGDPLYRLCGHSIGAIVTGGYYDMEYGWKGEQGEFLAIGVDYMYALPLGKGGVHLEIDLGAGYAVNLYRDYDVRYEGGHLIGKRPKEMRHLPVPLRARVCLVVPIMKKVQ